MHSFRLADHTADLRLSLEGSSFSELCLAGLLGLAHVLKPGFCEAPSSQTGAGPDRVEQQIEVSAPDLTALLIDFLSESLYLSNVEKAVFCGARIDTVETRLAARLQGFRVKEFDDDVKAVTYREAEIRIGPAGLFSTTVVLDI